MIAAALIPAAAAVGVGVAWSQPSVAVGAFVLLVVNVTAVNFAGFLVLWWLGYRPTGGRQDDQPDEDRWQAYRPTLAAVAVLLLALVVSGGVVGQQIAVERQVTGAVSATLDRPAYSELELQSVQTQFDAPGIDGTGHHVRLVLSRPIGHEYPALSATMADRLRERLRGPVTVSITYQDRQQSGSAASARIRAAGDATL